MSPGVEPGRGAGRTPWLGPNWKETREDCDAGVFFSTRAGAQECPGESPQTCLGVHSGQVLGALAPTSGETYPVEQEPARAGCQGQASPDAALAPDTPECMGCVCVCGGGLTVPEKAGQESCSRLAPHPQSLQSTHAGPERVPSTPTQVAAPPSPWGAGGWQTGTAGRIPQRPPQSLPLAPQSPALTALG